VKQVTKKTYNYTDLHEFQPPNLYSSVGKMQLSQKKTEPCYGFGTSDRKQQAKVFRSKELSSTQFVGKTSPGPNYEVRHTDKYYYKDEPKWSFSKDTRNTLNTGPKHAHYNRQDVDFDPTTADDGRRWKSATTKIGLASRFTDDSRAGKGTPGPEYDPGFKPHLPGQPKYSFGVRREVKGASPIVAMGSTPNQVGPGSYISLQQASTSIQKDAPKFSFPQDPKMKPTMPSIQKNMTYDVRSSIGPQVLSKKKTMASSTFGKAGRSTHTGTFKSHMSTQPTSIRIQMPRF
jgi:hypothetical protein